MPVPTTDDDPDAAARDGAAATLGHRAEWLGLRAAASLIGALPLETASATMGRLWRRFAPFNRRHERAGRHLRLAMPELDGGERAAVLSAMWDNLGRTFAESLRLADVAAEPDRFELAVDKAALGIERGRGAVFATLHQGNWELSGTALRLAGIDAAAVYRPLHNPLSERFLHQTRAAQYPGGLFPVAADTPLRLRSLARRGVSVCMVADLRDRTGVRVPFFGHPADAASFPAVLARRLDLPLVAGRVLRTGGVRFRAEAVAVPVPRSADVREDVLAATLALNACFEDWIRRDPGQWMWATRRWAKGVEPPPAA